LVNINSNNASTTIYEYECIYEVISFSFLFNSRGVKVTVIGSSTTVLVLFEYASLHLQDLCLQATGIISPSRGRATHFYRLLRPRSMGDMVPSPDTQLEPDLQQIFSPTFPPEEEDARSTSEQDGDLTDASSAGESAPALPALLK
jgi:hypothetical protein